MMVVLALLATAAVAQADLIPILSDNFDGYANQAALDAAYTQIYPATPFALDQTQGYSDGQSIHATAPHANYERRMYKNIGQWDGSDDFPLKLEFMVNLADDGTADWWTREYIELRSYEGGAYGSGGLLNLVAVGATSSGVDTTMMNNRVLYGSSEPSSWSNYANLTRQAVHDAHWTKLTTLFKSSTVEFYVNGTLDSVRNINPGMIWDSVVIGSGLSTNTDMWFDDLVISIVPEPATLVFLMLGGLFLRRRRA